MAIDANILIYILLGAVAALFLWIIVLEFRLKKLFEVGRPGNTEKMITEVKNSLENLSHSHKKVGEYLESVEKRLHQSVQNIEVVRFNPFNNAGSNQSFAIAILDETGKGAVISSLYSREGVKIYAKPVISYESEYSLTKEEQEVIRKTQETKN